MVGPPSLKNEPATLLPGGITYVANPTGQGFRAAVDVRIDLSALAHDIAEVQGLSRGTRIDSGNVNPCARQVVSCGCTG
jgi:hypothetical protein